MNFYPLSNEDMQTLVSMQVPQNTASSVNTASLQPSNSGNRSVPMSQVSSILGQAFGSNPVSIANQAINTSMKGMDQSSLAQGLLNNAPSTDAASFSPQSGSNSASLPPQRQQALNANQVPAQPPINAVPTSTVPPASPSNPNPEPMLAQNTPPAPPGQSQSGILPNNQTPTTPQDQGRQLQYYGQTINLPNVPQQTS